MIELSAKLLRGPVYLAGEIVECSVTFRNPAPSEPTRSQSNRYISGIGGGVGGRERG